MTIEQTEKILQGCEKQIHSFSKKFPQYCVLNQLCPTCKAQAQTLLETYKEEVEFLEKLMSNNPKSLSITGKVEMKERISTIKSCINKLEDVK